MSPKSLQIKVRVGSMIKENMVTFQNCCSSQAVIDKNLILGTFVEEVSKCWKKELFLSTCEFNSHFPVKIEKLVKRESE